MVLDKFVTIVTNIIQTSYSQCNRDFSFVTDGAIAV